MINIDKTIRKYNKEDNIVAKIVLEELIRSAANNGLLDFLDKILEKDDHISILDMDFKLFENPIYVKKYGKQLLIDNINNVDTNILDYGIKSLEYNSLTQKYESSIKDKIITILNNKIPFTNINNNLLFMDNLSSSFFENNKEIFKDKILSEFIYKYFNYDSNDIEYINLLANNIDEKNYFEFFIYNFETFNANNYKVIIKHEYKYLHKLIKIIINVNIPIELEFDEFIQFYNENQFIINNIDNNIENFKHYFLTRFIKINTLEELNNIKNLNYKYILDSINKKDNINDIKKIITKNYTRLDYEILVSLIDKIKNLNKSDIIYNELESKIIEIFTKLINSDVENIKNILNILNDIPNINELINNIENKYNNYCKSDIIENLYNPNNNSKVIILDGQPFSLLVHKIKGHGSRSLANELSNNPSLWTKVYVKDSYISSSLISDLFLGVDSGPGCIFGFKNITNKDILDMGTCDIFTSIGLFRSNRTNPKSNYLPHKMLIRKTNMLYNEIAINRYNDKKAILPDYIICFDKINITDKIMAKYFNIPIILIYKEKYIERMNENLLSLLENYNFNEYYDYRNNKIYSIYDDNKLLEKELNPDKLYAELKKIVDKMNEYIIINNYDTKVFKMCIQILKRIIKKNKNTILPKLSLFSENYKIDIEVVNKSLKLTKEN